MISGPNFGLILFEQEKSGPGIASLNGGPPFQCESPHHLPPADLWLSNVPFVTFNSAGLSNFSTLRNSGYLKTRLYQIESFLGLQALSSNERGQALSNLYARLLNTSLEVLQKPLLKTALRHEFTKFWKLENPDLHYFKEIADRTYQPWFPTTFQTIKNSYHTLTLKLPEVSLLKLLLNSPAPGPNWKNVQINPNENEKNIEFVKNSTSLYLAEIQISNIDKKTGNLLALNQKNITGSSKNKLKTFITSHEFRFLSNHADFNIIALYKAKKQAPSKTLFSLLETDFYKKITSPLGHSSWTANQLAENIIHSLPTDSAPAIFFNGKIKEILFAKAHKLQNAGYTILGYGNGKIIIVKPPEDKKIDLVNLSLSLGLIPPMAFTKTINHEFETTFWNGEQLDLPYAIFHANTKLNELMEIDRSLNEPELLQESIINNLKTLNEKKK